MMGNVWAILEPTLKGQGRDGVISRTALPCAGRPFSPAGRGCWRECPGPACPPKTCPLGFCLWIKGESSGAGLAVQGREALCQGGGRLQGCLALRSAVGALPLHGWALHKAEGVGAAQCWWLEAGVSHAVQHSTG